MTTKKHAREPEGKSESVWIKTPTPNLIRYGPKGTYYLRARVGGKIVRESLKTTKYSVAQVKLGERLSQLRLIGGSSSDSAPETLADAIALIRAQIVNDHTLKTRSRGLYLEELERTKPGEPAELPAKPVRKLTKHDMELWWSKVVAEYAPQRANHILMFVRRALNIARKAGVISVSPAEDLKPTRIPRTRLDLPTPEQFRSLVASIRSQHVVKRGEQSADWLEFMAYSGMRPGEIQAVRWEHIDDKAGVIMVYGGKEGTKNHEPRPVPIIPPMAELLQRLRAKTETHTGPIFTVKKPSQALTNACKRLKIPHQRVYNLRHLFATQCRDAGVPVPTFAEWLGHKDGGALAMKTYIQRSNEHTKRAAALVKFT